MIDENLCTFYLVRHGQTEWNLNRIIMGQKDSPLTDDRLKQAQEVAEIFKSVHFDAIFSSDLLRAERTAEIIKLERNLAVQTSKLLRERSYGKYEGESSDELRHIFDAIQKLPSSEVKSKFGDAVETNDEVVARFTTYLREIAVSHRGKTVLVVTHGECIRTFLIHLGYAKNEELPGGSFKNGGYVKLRSDGIDFFLSEVQGVKRRDGAE